MASAVGATGVVLLVDAAVAVPTTGVWGWLGYTTITACPWVIPVALVSGAAVGYVGSKRCGVSKLNDETLRIQQSRITSELNAALRDFQD